MNKHDKHYQNQGPYEPIQIIEHFLKTTGVPPLVAYSLGQVLRYILRAGQKDGQPWQKDIEKGLNYMHRALNGDWVPDDDKATEEMHQVVKRHFVDSISLDDLKDRPLNGMLNQIKDSGMIKNR